MKTGQMVKRSGAKGKTPVPIFHYVAIFRDGSARRHYDQGKYLPHVGEKQIAKAKARP